MNTIDTNEIWIDPWVDPSEALPHSEPVVDPLVQEDLLAFLSEPLELSPADLTPQPRLETPPQPFASQPDAVAGPGSPLEVTQLSDAEQEAYQLLEVPTWASASELQAAYRNQMQQVHPDRLPAHTPLILRASAEREFKRLQDAYRLLVNRTAPNTHVNLGSVPAQDPPSQSHLIDGNVRAGNAGLSDQPPRPSLPAVPVPTEPAGLPLLAQIQTWLGSSPAWAWLAVGGTGAVLGFGLGVLALSTSPASTSTTTGSTVPPTDPISVDPTSLAGAEIVLPPPSSSTSQLAAAGTGAPDRIRLAQIDRFALILQELRPHLDRADQELALATDPAVRSAIEAEFNRMARPIIESYGLEAEEYQRIAQLSQEDAEIADQIVEAAERLQLRQPTATE